MPDDRTYDDEDVKAVIARALERQSGSKLTHTDLVGIGDELGLSADDIESAAQDVAEERREAEARRAIESRRRKWLARHGVLFAVLNGLFFLVNFLTTPGQWWFLFPVVIWGLLLLLHGWITWELKGSGVRASRRIASGGRSKALPRQRVDASPALEEDVDEEARTRSKKTFP